MTSFGVGIAVDSSFAAAPGFGAMGPLVAGNVVDAGPVWLVEHCRRKSAYGSTLGAALAEDLLVAPAPKGSAVQTS